MQLRIKAKAFHKKTQDVQHAHTAILMLGFKEEVCPEVLRVCGCNQPWQLKLQLCSTSLYLQSAQLCSIQAYVCGCHLCLSW